MQDVKPDQKTVGPGKLDRVQFLFQNSGMVAQGLGHGYRVLDMFSYTNELGLYAAGRSKTYFVNLAFIPLKG
jgi:hypothetical protein